MSIQAVFNQLTQDNGPILLLIVAVATLVQITPIKINPWSALFGWIGRQINKEVVDKINVVEARLNDHINESSDAELRARRAAILDFSSSILRGVNYHKEKFEFMITECDSYEKYCKDNDIRNGVAEASIAEIRKIYQDHLHRNDFLSDKKGE